MSLRKEMKDLAHRAKEASVVLSTLPTEVKNRALKEAAHINAE